ncbi:ADP-ribose pyrophosphatase [Labrenzia sp. EL_142]|nr:ADP-ribose pyrophosphatase [Labrenzia sp. EL_142]
MDEIKCLGRRTTYQNRWMKVHEDAVQFPDGSEGIYGIVDKEDFVLIVPRHADGRFQLVQQYRYPVSGRNWEFPQGSWETKPGAEPEKVALGELEEETGFQTSSLQRLGHLYEAYGFSNQGFHVFLADQLKQGTLALDNEEQGMVTASFSRDELVEMITSGQIKDAPTIAALGLLTIFESE